jgi:hypothetical protein
MREQTVVETQGASEEVVIVLMRTAVLASFVALGGLSFRF